LQINVRAIFGWNNILLEKRICPLAESYYGNSPIEVEKGNLGFGIINIVENFFDLSI